MIVYKNNLSIKIEILDDNDFVLYSKGRKWWLPRQTLSFWMLESRVFCIWLWNGGPMAGLVFHVKERTVY
jgi:hypothetical protein